MNGRFEPSTDCPLKIGRLKKYCWAANANTNVTTARYRPLTRSDPSPRTAASMAVATVVVAMATQNGTPTSTRRAAKRAPRPAKAI